MALKQTNKGDRLATEARDQLLHDVRMRQERARIMHEVENAGPEQIQLLSQVLSDGGGEPQMGMGQGQGQMGMMPQGGQPQMRRGGKILSKGYMQEEARDLKQGGLPKLLEEMREGEPEDIMAFRHLGVIPKLPGVHPRHHMGQYRKGGAIPGGLAAGKRPGDFDKGNLALGMKVEKEHTKNKAMAREIAMDHLMEDPNYYTQLPDPEIAAQQGAASEAQGMMRGGGRLPVYRGGGRMYAKGGRLPMYQGPGEYSNQLGGRYPSLFSMINQVGTAPAGPNAQFSPYVSRQADLNVPRLQSYNDPAQAFAPQGQMMDIPSLGTGDPNAYSLPRDNPMASPFGQTQAQAEAGGIYGAPGGIQTQADPSVIPSPNSPYPQMSVPPDEGGPSRLQQWWANQGISKDDPYAIGVSPLGAISTVVGNMIANRPLNPRQVNPNLVSGARSIDRLERDRDRALSMVQRNAAQTGSKGQAMENILTGATTAQNVYGQQRGQVEENVRNTNAQILNRAEEINAQHRATIDRINTQLRNQRVGNIFGAATGYARDIQDARKTSGMMQIMSPENYELVSGDNVNPWKKFLFGNTGRPQMVSRGETDITGGVDSSPVQTDNRTRRTVVNPTGNPRVQEVLDRLQYMNMGNIGTFLNR